MMPAITLHVQSRVSTKVVPDRTVYCTHFSWPAHHGILHVDLHPGTGAATRLT